MTTIYIQWSDDGQFIRKWSREPFEGGEAFSRQGSLDDSSRGARPLLDLIPDYLPPLPAGL